MKTLHRTRGHRVTDTIGPQAGWRKRRRGEGSAVAWRGWCAAAVGVILIALAIGGPTVWQDLLFIVPGVVLTGWGLRQVASDPRPAPLRPNPQLPSGRLMMSALTLGIAGASLLLWLTLDVSPMSAALFAVGTVIFVVGGLCREVPDCPPVLAKYAPAVAFVGWTIEGLGRHALSPAIAGAVFTTGLVFGCRAWWARRRRWFGLADPGSPSVRGG
ncbi:MAG: hypothetical protein H0U10_13300 [Chloroflexia bacterium]|nr:hypothetical protein [Chloroflexia bacterium]